MAAPISVVFSNVLSPMRPKLKVLSNSQFSLARFDYRLKQEMSVRLENLYNDWMARHPDAKVNQLHFHNDIVCDSQGTVCNGQVIILFSVDDQGLEGLEETVEST